MIDIHTHCLPGLDDGASDVNESMEMLIDSRKQGVRVCVATSHCTLHHPLGLKEFISGRELAWQKLKAKMEQTEAELPKVLLGAEVYLDHDISDFPELEKLCIGTTNYMLVEFSRETMSPLIPDWLYELTVRGIKPIVAHLDRYMEWEDILNLTTGTDIIYQLNADNFMSFFGRRHIKKILEYERNYIISSDMHNTSERASKMHDAYKKSIKMFPSLTKKMFWDIGYEIIKKDI
ncbi:MAG: hypothetical protein IJN39_06805 [Clostridia bacterium]|nr:hypothetical protein [Clostridia bacterium]